ncbi:MAG TPA: cytochrome d ubiquinol oxidase subunit II [Deltaproteobacteria bacterium]|nr:cytochrome d ubiquinol oxidase subunit II [Deltaproteobacteria bacterium]
MLLNIWFFLWGLLWAVYFMLDGFDLGLGTLLPVLAKNDDDRRMIYNAMGPFWDGNEVWLITAGGVTFAAFPTTYAVMFSSLYTALLIILFALILRGVTFEFRNKVDKPFWRSVWDWCLVVGSFVPALLFGVAFANIFKGIPIDQNGVYHGTLFTLLNPYGLIGGLLFLFLFLVHGSIWLAIKTEGELHERGISVAKKLWPVLLVIAVVFLGASKYYTHLYDNYFQKPILFAIPAIAAVALVATRYFLGKGAEWKAWFASSLTIVTATFFGVAGLYPNLFPSSLDPKFSLTIYNSASSPLTLKIMLGVALTLIPIVILYQAWAYNAFKHKLTEEDLAYDEAY